MSKSPQGVDTNEIVGSLVVVAVLVFVGLQVVGKGVIDTTLVVTLLGAGLTLLGVREGVTFLLNRESLLDDELAERTANRRGESRNGNGDGET